ncbi:hypothetical protein SEA_STEAMY_86 [Mycobacterium phage Steamy]|uniref:Uncharacterized protein n=1 Tax=Mycobacterium phage Steamy TaxID=2250309 RepID=A0A345L0Q8_9CAUD|nr:hypothetical protein KIV62_gp15 [Mycobacterium phage Steamy]AXH48860.1 hypothetical protein SEA_STEAMY_86 [Mycobacterium phage Steamy]
MARARINKEASSCPEFPWFYTVEHEPRQEDALDYGSVESFERALECVEAAIKHPERY